MPYQKAVLNDETGELEYIPLTDEEIKDVEDRVAAAASAAAEEAARITEKMLSIDEINNAKTIQDLKAIIIKIYNALNG